MKKELRPFHDAVSCEICGRTMLKGERTEAYLAPGGHRNLVCALCFGRAEQAGWIRESASDQIPTRAQHPQERRALLGRLRRRRDAEPAAPEEATADLDEPEQPAADHDEDWEWSGREEPAPDAGADASEPDPDAGGDRDAPGPRRRPPPQDPRHVRAVPTTAEVKVERALDLFNRSEHQRTVAALTRSLGFPWATAVPDATAPSVVTVVVAWELSWYRYKVDLGDTSEPVALQDKGDEVEDIEESLRGWNAGLDEDGRLVVANGAVEEGPDT